MKYVIRIFGIGFLLCIVLIVVGNVLFQPQFRELGRKLCPDNFPENWDPKKESAWSYRLRDCVKENFQGKPIELVHQKMLEARYCYIDTLIIYREHVDKKIRMIIDMDEEGPIETYEIGEFKCFFSKDICKYMAMHTSTKQYHLEGVYQWDKKRRVFRVTGEKIDWSFVKKGEDVRITVNEYWTCDFGIERWIQRKITSARIIYVYDERVLIDVGAE